jgi:hypothetical protein
MHRHFDVTPNGSSKWVMEMLLLMSCITLTSNTGYTTVKLLISEGNYRSNRNSTISGRRFPKKKKAKDGRQNLKFHISNSLHAVLLKIAVFWDMATCSCKASEEYEGSIFRRD